MKSAFVGNKLPLCIDTARILTSILFHRVTFSNTSVARPRRIKRAFYPKYTTLRLS